MSDWTPMTEQQLNHQSRPQLIAEILHYREAAKGQLLVVEAARVKAEELERESVISQAILQSAPKPWITDSNYHGPEWMAEYRKWWIRRLPGTSELLDGKPNDFDPAAPKGAKSIP